MEKPSLIPLFALLLSACISSPTGTPQGSNSLQTEQRTVHYSVVISNYTYTPTQIDVKLGDRVVLSVTNQDSVTHGISLPTFGVQEFVGPGQTQTVEFVADQLGAPETFCSSDHGEKLLINIQP